MCRQYPECNASEIHTPITKGSSEWVVHCECCTRELWGPCPHRPKYESYYKCIKFGSYVRCILVTEKK